MLVLWKSCADALVQNRNMGICIHDHTCFLHANSQRTTRKGNTYLSNQAPFAFSSNTAQFHFRPCRACLHSGPYSSTPDFADVEITHLSAQFRVQDLGVAQYHGSRFLGSYGVRHLKPTFGNYFGPKSM